MTHSISGRLLLDSKTLDDPALLYEELHARAPVWEITGTGLFAVSTFELVAEAAGRVEDFSSNISFLLYRDEAGLPCRLPFGDAGVQALATRISQSKSQPAKPRSSSWGSSGCDTAPSVKRDCNVQIS